MVRDSTLSYQTIMFTLFYLGVDQGEKGARKIIKQLGQEVLPSPRAHWATATDKGILAGKCCMDQRDSS
jgi:hypothetical protein